MGARDTRIKVHFGQINLHIAGASNKALEMATGDFIALLDNDDELVKSALWDVVEVLNDDAELDFIYSDEDKITTDGVLVDPHFKPDWSPETFGSMMYTCHLSVFRKSMLVGLGGFRVGFEGSQDYDLVLRVTEQTDRIYHIPKILYHWRKIPGSAADSTNAKGYAYVSAIKALESRLERQGIEGSVEHGKWVGSYRVRPNFGSPQVGIIIPFRDEIKMTSECVRSVLGSTYRNYKIYLVSNDTSDANLSRIKQSFRSESRVFFLDYPYEFNYSKINNWTVGQIASDYIVFLNNDTKIISREWMEAMLEMASSDKIGAVGCKLIYPDKTIQHAGVILGIVGIGNHAFRHLPSESHGYFGYLDIIRNYSAVTAACMMIGRKVFEQVGGFDEENLKIAYNDVDLCLKLLERGYRNVYTPFAEAYHYESKSRGSDTSDVAKQERFQKEVIYFQKKWASYLNRTDYYYNPNLSLSREDFYLKLEPVVKVSQQND
ncbi:MAG: glycosyltransferase family 2 protein [Saprospiraceae bacterium]|nr:glycosyltransferase family 2 protein [Saprospiraceae bacterium]